MNLDELLAETERAVTAGELEHAERLLSQGWADVARAPARALHLLGDVKRKQERFLEAERYYRAAIAAEPEVARHYDALAELFASLGFSAPAAEALARALEREPDDPERLSAFARHSLSAARPGDAETALRRLLAIRPSARDWLMLSQALLAQDKPEAAIEAADRALEIEPASVEANSARAHALAGAGRNQEALEIFDALEARGIGSARTVFARGVALSKLARAGEAEGAFADGVRRWPSNLNLQRALANARWMQGEGEAFVRDFERAVAANPADVRLRLACADLLRRADFRARAELLLRDGLTLAPEEAALLASLGVLLDETDRTEEGAPLLQRAAALMPAVAEIRANLTCALLRLERSEEAFAEIAPWRRKQPLNQEWICYETMALRQLGDPRYRELCDYDRMVRAYELAPPPGFSDIAAFNEALAASLGALHVLESHPLDQSLRGGSQTSRSLLHVSEPVIQAYLRALEEPIGAYVEAMGEPDQLHPWSGRKTKHFRMAGCWSVKLKAKGYHINHVHPAGWISSAYYVRVPPAVADGRGRQGWITFGEPRWPTPKCTVEKMIKPTAGALVLFPSYMWHGTIPFEEGERITAPFDVVPG